MAVNLENSAVAKGLEMFCFHSNPKERQCQRMLKLSQNFAFISHTSKITLKILQARLQQYMNCEHLDVQDRFRKCRGTRDQIANIGQIIEKAREFQKNIYFCYTEYFCQSLCADQNKLENSSREGNTRSPDLPPEKPVCRSRSNSQNWTWNKGLIQNWERSTLRLYIVTLLI